MDRRTRTIVYLCFLLSGAAGLIYEVVWARQMALFLGITTYAHTAVITAYMLGLAAGSLILGRRADRWAAPLRAYALLEAGVGAYAALTPWLFKWLQSVYAVAGGGVGVTGLPSHLLRFALSLLSLLVPTFLMGGTLPVLVRGMAHSLPDLASVTGRLYGVNTLGATLGAFAAGYLLLPALGVRGTIFIGVALNLAVAAAVLAFRRRAGPAAQEVAPAVPHGSVLGPHQPRKGVGKPLPASRRPKGKYGDLPLRAPWAPRVLFVGFALSGLAALIYELAWIRALIPIIGSSVYAFAATLATYLAGLGLGSLLYARFLAGWSADSHRELGLAAALEVGISLGALAGLALIGLLPGLFLRGFQAGLHNSFPLFQAYTFGLCFLVMIVPTLLLGALFPLVTALWARNSVAIGRGVGTAYAANTIGTILGSLLGGLLLLPALGVHGSVVLAAGLHSVVGAAFWLLRAVSAPARAYLRFIPAAVALLLFGLTARLVPAWDRDLMSTGVFSDWQWLLGRPPAQSVSERARSEACLFYEEGIEGTVAVKDSGEQRFLVINGKSDATSRSDLPTQVMLGELPLLLRPDARDVLVIGLGSGTTAGSIASHPSVERITVLEISPEVVRASDFFAEENRHVLADPRLHLVVTDARNFMLADSRKYDVISSEPSNPWISGVSNLFTRDFFELARRRLAPGGIITQWFHTYSMSSDDLRSVLRTFQSVFPYITVWEPIPGDLLLTGSEDPQSLDLDNLRAVLDTPSVRADLARIGVTAPMGVVHMFLASGDRLSAYTAGARLNTDDRPHVEFGAPRNLYADTVLPNELELINALGQDSPAPVLGLAVVNRSGFSVPDLHVEVRAPGVSSDDMAASWSVRRGYLTDDAGAVSDVGVVDSQLGLAWPEERGSTQLSGIFAPSPASAEELRALLQSPLAGRLVQGGDITLAGSVPGQWVLARGQEPGEIEIGIAWACPGLASPPSLLAFGVRPDPGQDGWGRALQEFAGPFRCAP